MKKGLIIFAVIIIVVVAAGFYQYSSLEESGGQQLNLSTLTTTFSATNDNSSDMQQVQALLAVLGQVSVLSQLDTSLFHHPAYKTLRDFSITLFPAENIGRPNPFLRIGERPLETPATTAPDTQTDSSNQNSANAQSEQLSDAEPGDDDAGELFDQLSTGDGEQDPLTAQ